MQIHSTNVFYFEKYFENTILFCIFKILFRSILHITADYKKTTTNSIGLRHAYMESMAITWSRAIATYSLYNDISVFKSSKNNNQYDSKTSVTMQCRLYADHSEPVAFQESTKCATSNAVVMVAPSGERYKVKAGMACL